MDAEAILASLIFNRTSPESGEGLARLIGIVHLYRASGIHLLAFFSFVTYLCEIISHRLEVSVRFTRTVSLLLCVASLFWVWHLQDFRPSFIRPLATYLVRSFFRNRGAVLKLGIPLLFTFLIEWASTGGPWKSAGALHYYFAVAGGLFAWDRLKNQPVWLKHLGLSTGSWLPIAMIDLVHDHLVSYLTPVFSYFSLPLISFCLYPLTLGSLLFQSNIPQFLIKLWQAYLDALLWISDAGLSFAVVSARSVWGGGGLALIVSFGFYRSSRKATLSLAILFSLCLRLAFDSFPLNRAIQIDVGQGDSALLQQNDRNEMIDVGGSRAKSTEAWIRELARLNVLKIDGVLLTHLDEDHVGALRRLIPAVPLTCIETHLELQKSEKGQKLKSLLSKANPAPRFEDHACLQLARVHWFLSEQSGAAGGNELMAGTIHRFNSETAYFALGDGDVGQELEFAQVFREEIAEYPHRIWKVSHHGSRFSSGSSFLNRLQADEFWISAGAHNRYHHPHPATLLKLSQLRGRIRRTDQEGDLYWTE